MNVEEFATAIKIEPSSRSHVLMLMGFFGYSGGGKTVTALIAAAGLAGPDAEIGIIDTEQKRSGIAADVAKNLALKRYNKVPKIVAVYLEPPFHPLKYVAAIKELQKAGCKAIVVDSMSHAWSGDGGYLDLKEEMINKMAGNDFKQREKCGMAAAARVKPHTHGKLVDTILHVNVPMILCFRAKEKTTMQKKEGGGMQPTRDEFATPIQEEGLIFEMLISGECTANKDGDGGYCRFRGQGCKHTHPDLLRLLPKESEQFSFAHAEALAKWCAAPGESASDHTAELKKRLWNLTKPIHGENQSKLLQFLIDESIVESHQTLAALTEAELSNAINKSKEKMAQRMAG